MIDIERRLHHAARELREVEIEPPPLLALSSSPAAGRRPSGLLARVPALVMPVLFVLGGLAVVAGGADRQTTDTADATPSAVADATIADTSGDAASDTATGSTNDASSDVVAASSDGPALTAREEVALISALAPSPASAAPATAPSTSPPTSLRHYR